MVCMRIQPEDNEAQNYSVYVSVGLQAHAAVNLQEKIDTVNQGTEIEKKNENVEGEMPLTSRLSNLGERRKLPWGFMQSTSR